MVKELPQKKEREPGWAKQALDESIRHSAWAVFLLVGTTLVVYFRVIGFDFVKWDDPLWVSENVMVKNGFSWDALLWSFSGATEISCYWAPLTWLSFFLDHSIYGMNAGGYHFTNLLLHIANTLLIFFCLKWISRALWASALVAALFALHPLHVESVAWITERKDVLSAFFWMLSIWVYAWYVKKTGSGRYLLLLMVFSLGLMAKPMLVTLPLILLLLDDWPLGRLRNRPTSCRGFFGRPVMEKLPLFFLVVCISFITWFFQAKGGAAKPLSAIGLDTRAANVLSAYWWYLEKMVWPIDLAAIYPYSHSPSLWAATASGLALAGITAFAAWCYRRFPFITIGWLWYLISLLPVCGLVVIGPHSVADRYSYIPLLGPFFVLVWSAVEVSRRWGLRAKKYGPKVLGLVATVLIVLLMGASYRQVPTWKNTLTLFSHAQKITDDSYLIHTNLGYALADEGRNQEASIHFDRALTLCPEGAEAYNGRGNVRLEIGDTQGALSDYRKAAALDSDFAEPLNGSGLALAAMGMAEEAVASYELAIAKEPEFVEAYNNLGLSLSTLGKAPKALENFRKAVYLKPDFVAGRVSLGNALAAREQFNDAIAQYDAALAFDPDAYQAAYSLGLVMEKTGKRAAAGKWYRRAIEINASFYPAANNLGGLFARAGRPKIAAAFFRQALRYASNDTQIRENLKMAEAAAAKTNAVQAASQQ